MNDSSTVNPDLSLGNLGLDSLMAVEIRQKLERDHDISMSAEEIRALTFAKLDQLSASTPQSAAVDTAPTASKLVDAASVRLLLNRLCPSEAVVEMNRVDTDAAPLFVIHGVSGYVFHLSSVMSKIRSAKVYGIQCTRDAPLTSIPNLARHNIQVHSLIHNNNSSNNNKSDNF